MKWGAIVRGESRGLGNLTNEVHRNLHPDRTLLIEMGELAKGFPIVHDYPDAMRVPFVGGVLDEDTVRDWMRGLDVIWTAETFYDWRIVTWAREMGVRTVNYVMPEFYRAELTEQADVVWNPTTWRHDSLPDGARVVPFPVALDRLGGPEERTGGPIRVLHNAGHRAAMDRNGTATFYAALRQIRTTVPIEVTISGQDGRLPAFRPVRNLSITNRAHGSPDYWDVPAGFDMLVMPRRYGGLCLPVQEAMAAGVVPLMPDVSPNLDWPVWPLQSRPYGEFRTPGGLLKLAQVDASVVAREIAWLADHTLELAQMRASVLAWAGAHSWGALRPVWRAELGRVVDGVDLPR